MAGTEHGKPVLMVVTGLPGSGKTTLCEALSRVLHVPYIDYDTVCQPFLEEIAQAYPDGRSYRDFCAFWRKPCYAAVMDSVMYNLRLGLSVIVSAPFTREKQDPSYFSHLKASSGLDFNVVGIDLHPDEHTLRQNLERRGLVRDIEKLRDWPAFHQQHQGDIPQWDADTQCAPDYTCADSVLDQVLRVVS